MAVFVDVGPSGPALGERRNDTQGSSDDNTIHGRYTRGNLMKMYRHAVRMAGAWLLTGALSASASQVVWETLFDPALAPGVDDPDPYYLSLLGGPSRSMQLSAAAGGDFYSFAVDTAGHATIARHSGADDAVLWRRSVGMQHSIRPDQGLLAGGTSADGGVWLSHGGATRFSADGGPLWSRAIATWWPWPSYVRRFVNGDLALAQVRYDVIGPGARLVVMRVDGRTGAVLAQRELGETASSCHAVPIETDASDSLYVSLLCGSGSSDGFQRVVKLASDLSTQWDIGMPSWDAYAPGYEQGVAVADGLYLSHRLSTDFRLSRFDASDGRMRWSVPGNWSSLRMAGGCLLGVRDVDGARSMACLDPATGQSLWSRVLDSGHALIEASLDIGILAGVGATGSSAFVERFNLASGAPIWRTALTASTAGRVFHPRDLLLSDDVVRISGADCLPSIACVDGITRVQTATGQVSGLTYPLMLHTATADAIPDGDQTLLVASLESVPQGQRIRVKRIDAEGTVLWEHALPLASGAEHFDSATARRASNGDLVVAAASSTSRLFRVAKYDAGNAQQRWQRSFGGNMRPASPADLATDTAGDVLISTIQDSGFPFLYWRQIEKLSSSTGQSLWNVRLGGFTSESSLVAFWPVGDDFFVTEETSGTVRQGPRLHSGTDGSLIWNNPALTAGSSWLLTQHEGVGYLATADHAVVAFSMTDGSLRWRYVSGESRWRFGSAGIGSDGDLYIGGTGLLDENGEGVLIRLDRVSGLERWRTPLQVSTTRAPALPVEVVAADAGIVETTQSSASRTFLSRFDSETGGFVEGSMLAASPETDEAVAEDDARIGQRLPDGSLLAYGLAYRPGESRRPWVGRLVAPAQGQRGDLSMSLSLAASATQGASTLDLSAELRHAGEQNVQATAFVRFSHTTSVPGFTEVSIETAPNCVVTGIGSCQAIPTPTGIRLQLDLAPDAVANLTASLRAPLLPATRFVAEAYAPYGFFEADLRNNTAVAWWVTDRYFADDFE